MYSGRCSSWILISVLLWTAESAWAQEETFRFGLSWPAEMETTSPLTPEQEKRFVRWTRAMASQEKMGRQQLSRHQIESLLGRGRSRALDVARFDFHRHDLPLGRRLHDDPEAFERSRKTVLRAFAKLQRKALERALGLDDKLSRRRQRPAVDSHSAPSWRMRLSPRLSEDSIGLKVRLPYTGRTFWNHMSFYVRQSFDDDGTAMAIRFDDGARYVALEHTVDETRGRHCSLKVRLWF